MCAAVTESTDASDDLTTAGDLKVLLHVLSQLYLAKLRADKDDDVHNRSHLPMVRRRFDKTKTPHSLAP